MISVLVNDFRRLMSRKGILLVIVLLTAGATIAAVFMSTKGDTVANVALISSQPVEAQEFLGLNMTLLEETPAYSELVSAHYDAVVTISPSGEYAIETVKSDEIMEEILHILQYGEISEGYGQNSRGTGGTIIGYLVMFLLMEGSMLMFLFSDDKEHKQLDRIAASPIPVTRYILAHSLFNFVFIFVPAMVLVYLVTFIMGVSIGFTFFQTLFLFGSICAFATALSLMLHALMKKNDMANMAGSVIIILTTVLSGSFYSFEKGNPVLEKVITVLPQKAFLTFVEHLERGVYHSSILYVLLLTLGFFILAITKTNRDYVRSR